MQNQLAFKTRVGCLPMMRYTLWSSLNTSRHFDVGCICCDLSGRPSWVGTFWPGGACEVNNIISKRSVTSELTLIRVLLGPSGVECYVDEANSRRTKASFVIRTKADRAH